MEATYGPSNDASRSPVGVDDDKIAATYTDATTYTDGVLEVVVPAGAAQLPGESRQIPVKTVRPVKAA